MTTEQLDALMHAADDEARFPVSAGRAAIPAAPPEAPGGSVAPVRSEVAVGLVTALLATAAVWVLNAGEKLVDVAGVFGAVLATHLFVQVFRSYWRSPGRETRATAPR